MAWILFVSSFCLFPLKVLPEVLGWLLWNLQGNCSWNVGGAFIIAHGQGLTTEKAMAPHSSTLALKIPKTEEPGRLQSMGLLRFGHD